MKLSTCATMAMCSLLFVGCSQLNRVGSDAVVFDSDPFTQIDAAEASRNQLARNQPHAAGRVNVGNLAHNSAPPSYNNPPQQGGASQAQYTYNPALSTHQSAMNAHDSIPTQAVPSGPAARAAAEAAAMVASRQRRRQPIQQMSYETSTPMAVPAADVAASFGDDPFEPQKFPMQEAKGAVPMPPGTQANPLSDEFELTDADLALPSNEPSTDRRMFPGTNIPMPTGRATLGSVMPSEWEPTPADVPTQPVFSPPANQSAAPASVPAPLPAQAVPVIQDSTNQSKWQPARRH